VTGAELARLLRIIADGRAEYASSIPEDTNNRSLREQRDTLLTEAGAFRSAAVLALGDMSGVWRLLPTWRMTGEVRVLMAKLSGTGRTVGPWRAVTLSQGPYSGRGGMLGPETARRSRRWALTLECGHEVNRTVRYGPHKDGFERSRGGTQFRSGADVLPAPRRVRCERCAS
jgi:hypothetical protein